jgi:hypothetical protein
VLKSGFPTWNRDRYRLKDRRLASNVRAARHAAAIDECRAGFPATLWEALGEKNTRVGRSVYLQRWFAGYHGDIGGGGREAFTGRADALRAQAVNSGRGHQVLADWGSGLGKLLRHHPRRTAPWAEGWRKDRGSILQAPDRDETCFPAGLIFAGARAGPAVFASGGTGKTTRSGREWGENGSRALRPACWSRAAQPPSARPHSSHLRRIAPQ